MRGPMERFGRMGRWLEDRWRAHSFDEAAFAELAERALLEFAPWQQAEPVDAVRWVHDQLLFPSQFMRGESFGQPPITVHAGEGFVVDILFWLDATTSIHQHAFSGAFAVFAGSSIHSRYAFALEHRINAHARIGSISLRDVELLQPGDVRAIHSGERFIHGLFHLDRPSVSIVVRTRNDARCGPQYDYVRPRFSFDPFYSTPHLDKKRQTLTLLHRIGAAEYEDVLLNAVRRADLLEGFLLLDRSDGHSISEEGWSLTERALDALQETHGEPATVLASAIAERRRVAKLTHRRRRLTDADQRFFLALLLNIPDRRHILALVARRFADRDPVDTLLEWIATLGEGSQARGPALGVRLGDGAMRVLRGALQGHDVEAIAAALAREYGTRYVREQADGGDVRAEVGHLLDDLRRSDFFGPLVSDATEVRR